jgi:hypothetical protein
VAFHTVNCCCETVRKLVWALSVLSSDDVWLFGRLGDKLAERQEARVGLDLDRPVPICDVTYVTSVTCVHGQDSPRSPAKKHQSSMFVRLELDLPLLFAHIHVK